MYYEGTTGQRPQQFGQGLTIEENPLPVETVNGHAGGFQITLTPKKK